MSIRMRFGATVIGLLTPMVLTLGAVTAALAQAPPSTVNGWDNAYYQILADSLSRAGRGKWIYSADGHAVGRIADVRTSPDGMHEIAVVNVRRLMGGGQIALPIYRLSRKGGRILAKDERAAIRSMERIARLPTGRS